MATTASTGLTTVIVSENGGKGSPGTPGSDGAGFNQVRKSKLDNPLCHLFKTNTLAEVSAPLNTDADVTWTRSTTATYVDRYGIVKTAAIDTPREEAAGFLIEGASTNLCLYSDDFSNAVWTTTGAASKNAGAASVTNPDGTTQTVEFTVGTDGTGVVRQALTTSASNKSISIWVYITNKNSATTIGADYGNGTATQVDITSASLNEWVKLEFPNLTKGGLDTVDFHADVSGLTCYFFRAQLEDLVEVTSGILTTSAATTRTVDNVSISNIGNFPFADNSWSVSLGLSVSVGAQKGLLSLNTSGNGRVVVLASGQIAIVDSVASTSFTGLNVTDSQEHSIVITYDGSDVVVYLDGTPSAAMPATFSDSAVNQLLLGSGTAAEPLNGNLKDSRIYDFALSANEAEYLA